jgi:hypothetical protein
MTGNEGSSRKQSEGMLDKFEPGSESGPVEDATQRELRINQLPPDEKELALESARLADLCQYFSQEKMDIPVDLLDRIGRLSRLQPGERIRELSSINQELMEHLNRLGSGRQLWQ